MNTNLSNYFLSREACASMKSLGFREPSIGFYFDEGEPDLFISPYSSEYNRFNNRYSAILYEQAFLWFEERGIQISYPEGEGRPLSRVEDRIEAIRIAIEEMEKKSSRE